MCSENKGADQLRGYLKADLRFCFRICKNRFSHDAAHLILTNCNTCSFYSAGKTLQSFHRYSPKALANKNSY